MKRTLPTAGPTALGAPTIMDRALAQDHGADYVRLVAFAVDVDRLYGRIDAEGGRVEPLPFGWEIFLLEAYLLGALDTGDVRAHAMLEDACMSVLEQSPGQARLGSHLVFAVYDAVSRGALPRELAVVFHRWRTPPEALSRELAGSWQAPQARLAALAGACLAVELEPPPAPTTRAALERMASGDWSVGPLAQARTPSC